MADGKADVKAILARFQGSGGSTDESSTPGGHLKQPLHQTLSSGSAAQKKPAVESLSSSGINVTPKPNFLKPTLSSKTSIDPQELNKTKSIASRFANTQDDTNNKAFVSNKPLKPELKPLGQKPPLNKPSLGSFMSESKPVFPKPSLATGSKPICVKQDSGSGATTHASFTPPKIPSSQTKPNSSIGKLKLQNEDSPCADPVGKPTPQPSTLKPTSNFRTAQNMFNKDKGEQVDRSRSNTQWPVAAHATPPPMPLVSKKPSLKKTPPALPHSESMNGNASVPKRNPMPNTFTSAPAKPSRPPKVNLERFRRRADSSNEGPGFKKPTLPPAMAANPSHHGNPVTMSQPVPPAVPSLPPRHLGAINSQEDFYDDVDELRASPPPLPPSAGHPSQRAKDDDDDSDDGEMYEDLDDRWEAAEQRQDKKKEKAEKEEKKRLEAEKKEQKEREKKEQETRKKFKLVGPLEVIHQGKARYDCKGNRTDLALKQGDSLDIIRVQGNPEGKWLGRTADGSVGYVKTTSVEIDFNTLKNRQAQQSYEPAVYNDVDVPSPGISGINGPGVVLPPLPRDGEMYDDCVDPNLEVSPSEATVSPVKPNVFLRMLDRGRRLSNTKVVPPPSQFRLEGSSDQLGGAIDEEIYDDVDSQGAPPPPPISSLPFMRIKGRTEEMDPKKQKKFEKEEKEFRKKFKYEGEIQPLYQVTVIHMLTNKKWSGKELPVKGGETLDVIVKAVDNKLICRNEDGKFGYVSTAHIVMDDGEIYDDVGDDCIYDND